MKIKGLGSISLCRAHQGLTFCLATAKNVTFLVDIPRQRARLATWTANPDHASGAATRGM